MIRGNHRTHRNNDEVEQIPRVLDVASYTVTNDLQNALNKKQNAKHNVQNVQSYLQLGTLRETDIFKNLNERFEMEIF